MSAAPLKVAILVFDDVEVLDFAGPFEVFAVTAELAGQQHMRGGGHRHELRQALDYAEHERADNGLIFHEVSF